MNAVQYSAKAKEVVDAYNATDKAAKSGSFWNEDKVTFVRSEIKNFYITEQNHRCAYCNYMVPTNHNALWDAEHIISKAKNPEFLFEPRNLAISCRDCNTAKDEQEVRVNPGKKTFPDNSDDYLIVHPHFDEYEKHIRWYGSICAPYNSDKGKNTIVMCNLMRFAAKLMGIDGKVVDPEFDELIGKLLNAKSRTSALAAIAGLTVYVEAIPQDPQ